MALAALKTWVKEKLTFDDLNAEFSHIRNNALSLISPLTSALDFNGKVLILDADADTTITADTDDQIDIEIAGADDFQFTPNDFSALSGSTINIDLGATLAVAAGAVNSGITTRGYISGGILSRDSGDTTNDINVTACTVRDDTDSRTINLSSEITKRLDAAWAVGNDNGGISTGSADNIFYNVFVILRSDTGVVDVVLSLASVGDAFADITQPASYDYGRRIGSFLRTSAANVAFTQHGDEFLWDLPLSDEANNNPGTSAVSDTLTVPTSVKVYAIVSVDVFDDSFAGETEILVTSLDQADTAPSDTLFDIQLRSNSSNANSNGSKMQVRTNTSGAIRYRLSSSTADHTISICTQGWIDKRGKDGLD